MDYEVEPGRVGNISKRAPIGVAIVIVAVLAVAIGLADRSTSSAARRADSAASPVAAEASTTRPAATETVRSPDVARSSLRGPAFSAQDVTCHGIARAECLQIARAAVAALDPPRPQLAGIDIWPTLVCGDTIDCPLVTLRRVDPLGSAVVHFRGSKTEVWINVGKDGPGITPPSADSALEAWIVRWRY